MLKMCAIISVTLVSTSRPNTTFDVSVSKDLSALCTLNRECKVQCHTHYNDRSCMTVHGYAFRNMTL